VNATRRFLFLLASTRLDGNSERLARRAASRLPGAVQAQWLRLVDHPLSTFRDTRHDVGYLAPEGNDRILAEATLQATDLVFVTPVYWYSLPAMAKAYLDHWSAWFRVPELRFKETMRGRNLWAVVVDSSDPSEGAAEPLLGTLKRTADYMNMRWAGLLHAHANRPGEVERDETAWRAAETFFDGA
jgi:multimeric flavodoxin WrbA